MWFVIQFAMASTERNCVTFPVEQESNITTMRDFIAGTLREANEIDEQLHRLKAQLSERLRALDLATDDSFYDEARQILDEMEHDDTGDSMTRDEFVSAYRTT